MKKDTEPAMQNQQDVDFLSRHAHVLLVLFQDPKITAREISVMLDVTERTTLRVLNQLKKQGFISIERRGRNNFYQVLIDAQSSSRFENGCKVQDLLGLVSGDKQIKERKNKEI